MIRITKTITSFIISALLVMTMVLSASAAESYKTWTQSDPRWASKTLGSCSDTMSEIGCAVTSVAILAVHSQSANESSFNPGILCDYLSNNGGFDNYGNLYWGAVSGLVPSFTFQKRANITSSTQAGIASELAGYINEGYYIILSVQYDGHWIAIDTVSGNEVYMIDPAQNRTNNLFDYYDTDGMLQVRLYKGKVAPNKASSSTSQPTKTYLTGHYKTTSALNLRSSYSTSSNVLKTIPSGKTVVVTRVYNNEWGQVEYDGKTGWIYLEYTDYTESSYTYKKGNYKVNVNSGVYLRSDIGGQNSALCLIPYNTQLKINFITANWGKTQYNGKNGWVCMEYVSYTGTATTTTTTTKPATTTTTTTTTTTKAITQVTTTTTTESIPLIRGDVNRNGRCTKTDLILLNEYIANPTDVNFEKRYTMDVNHDGVIDERDSVYLLKIINKGN